MRSNSVTAVFGLTILPHFALSQSSSPVSSSTPSSSTPAEAGRSSAVLAEPKTEQRSIEPTQGQSSLPSFAADHREVSEEALKGPQGPAPVPAEEFEKEAKGLKPVKKENGAIENGSSKSTKSSHIVKHF